ncbi:alpha/beta hydrolase [Paracraurococcus lichenis]|uniref:Alpha/beta hydrolase n=1 Tax=Paracraurococcus lichenis TaxID=3064888 RepID=A0ABT9E7Y6_9PROT|nr:alpha/beta hydrolase [Paracraurococcus sp. LOR1-02]MDO9712322.1 alpha/beta hydrolase [Paracraurococcus sp. LOR1-02]
MTTRPIDPEVQAIRDLLAARPRPADLAERRKRLDALGGSYPLPRDVRVEPATAHGVPAEWTEAPGADASRVLLYLHGGGYVAGSLASHRPMVAEAGRQAGLRTLALDYRLAPEHPFPAAVEDAVAGYRHLLESGFAPGRIAIGGDSAGGGLTAAALLAIRDRGLPMPGCGWLVSPWVDLESASASMETKSAEDPMVQKVYLLEIAAMYRGGAAARDPLVSPLQADLRGLPPLLVQVGSAETLLDEGVAFAGKAGAAGVAVTLEVWPDMIHVWHLFHPQLAAGRWALGKAGAFLREQLAG